MSLPLAVLALSYLSFNACALASPVVATATAGSPSAPIIDLGYAQYQGAVDPATNITSFLSIRYAAPPTGDLRFAAPQTPANISGVQQATEYPSMCYQSGGGASETAPVSIYGFNKRATTTPAQSEDCLFLNVWVPPGNLPAEPLTTGGLPVVVWIHGGGYVSGYSASYDGADLLNHSSNGVVAVVLQYRLGVFGFLSGNEVKAGGALNAGLRSSVVDQNLALQWVQENTSSLSKQIATFGGDPSKVTIWGESAGAGSVMQHIVAHEGNTQPPLFRAGITSSTFQPSQYYYNDRIPQMYYNETVTYTGCSSSSDTLACLRAVNVTTLEDANNYLAGTAFWGTYVFAPVVDGTFIVERPSATLAKGTVNGNALLSIGNSHEGNTFVNPNETLTITDYVAQLFPDLTSVQVQEAAYLYSDFGSSLNQAFEVMGDTILVCPTYYLLQAFEGRSWKGIFAIPPGLHGSDVAYYFDTTPPVYNNTAFINAFSESFMSFVMSGDVNVKFDPTNITPYWDEYFIGETEMLFNRTEAYVPVVMPVKTDSGLVERCAILIFPGEAATWCTEVESMRPGKPVVRRLWSRGHSPTPDKREGRWDAARPTFPREFMRMASSACLFINVNRPRYIWHDLWVVLNSRVAAAPSSTSAPIVDLGYAQYQGALDSATNITSFLSIRYAAPPLGDLRFQAPQPPPTVSGIQQATTNPDSCYQTGFGAANVAPVSIYGYNKRQSTTPVSSEDCLYLNVFVPGELPVEPAAAGTGLPVLVWIHGGGYVAGYAEEFNGADLVLDSHNGAIVVVIQYRLGAFVDQTYALQWVQEHISLFGGDASHVTIWGESAGAGSVLQHIVANGGNTQPPLFSAATTSSTFLPSQYYYNDRIPQLLYDETVAMVGCSSSNNTFACLQGVDATDLQTANYDLAGTGFYGTYIFVPVVDGTFIVERPSVTLAKGQVNGDILLSVGNSNEGNIFVNANETLNITDYVAQLFPDMTPLQVQEAAYVYASYGTPLEQAIAVMGDSIFVCPTYYLLQAFQGRSWKGIFAIPPAYHGNDVAYYFNNPGAAPPYNNTEFINAFSQPFLSFAMSYNVNAKFDPTNITPYWDEYYIGETEMLFNRTEDYVPSVMTVKTDPALLERCAFWQGVTQLTAQ
ncbi:alpha/beta-hydrolase [Leucogyrophana mollusca]|uniref:Alpha/beta-hydrolase n=1 Tax=Leucogyrophana mollusca TaxID=85980 RepID=A0ACB8BQW9_9AGAM|nr:alpha/beta-hydrolase [Leucogyrophana mollusca]